MTLGSCQNEGRLIKENELQDIISEILLADVYVSQNDSIKVDSVDYFSPILKKYGYTVDDINYTLKRYALRKSSVLGEMLDKVSIEFDSLKRVYNYRGDMIKSWNEEAANRASKVVLFIDSLELKTSDKPLVIELPVHWSGKYTITYQYVVDSTLKKNSYSMGFATVDTIRGTRKHKGRYWMSWGAKSRELKSSVDINHRKNNLLEYTLPEESKTALSGSIRIDSLKIIFDPSHGHVNDDYLDFRTQFNRHYGGIDRDLEQLFTPPMPMPTDSLIEAILTPIDSLTRKLNAENIKLPLTYKNR